MKRIPVDAITHRYPLWVIAFGLTIVALLFLANAQPAQPDMFGIEEMYPTDPAGKSWYADWDGGEYAWSDDPWVETIYSNDVRYRNHDGVLTVTGETSRIYIRDPDKKRQWGNVEVTVYAKRVDDEGVPHSGIVTDVRTNHGMTATLEDAPCDSRGIFARLRNDGTADFGKETSHPNAVAAGSVDVFPNGLPHDAWIGYKHVVYDIPGGTHQELWMDLTGGIAGGEWQLLTSHDDHYGDEYGEVACAPGIDPTLPLTLGHRPGSESDLPNLSVLLRADGINHNGLEYRAFSVREIIAPQEPR